LEGKSANGEIKELLQLLAKPHVKVSLYSFNTNVKLQAQYENIRQFWLQHTKYLARILADVITQTSCITVCSSDAIIMPYTK